MKGTRGEILDLLRELGEATVATLTERLGIAPAALRRHLDILAAEGMVEHRSVKQPVGRPYFLFRLTEQAREQAATGYPRLLERMVLEIAALDPKDTGARDGQEILATVFGAISEHMAQDYRTKVRGETLDERADSLTTVLRPEGIVERWERRPDGIHLVTTVCPHRRVAQASAELCNAEARTLSTLLGCEVEQVARLVDGASCCEFVARGADGATDR